jgi:hypothetical protein
LPARPAIKKGVIMTGNEIDKTPAELGDNEDSQDVDEVDGEEDDELLTVLDDASRAELVELVGVKVVGLDVWEESLSDGEDEEPVAVEERIFFDCDLLLEDGSVLELYAAAVYPDPDGDPVKGMEQISQAIEKLSDDKLELLDFDQADEEGGLALAFGSGENTKMVVAASAWLVGEWEEDGEEGGDEGEEPA